MQRCQRKKKKQLTDQDRKNTQIEDAKAMRAEGGAAAATAKKVGVNKEFFRQLKAISVSSSREGIARRSLSSFSNTSFLVLRTYLSMLVARLDGIIVRDLVSANGRVS